MLVTVAFIAFALFPSSTLALPFNFNHFRHNNNIKCTPSVSTKIVTVTVTAQPGNQTPVPPVNNSGGKGNNSGKGEATSSVSIKTAEVPRNTFGSPPPVNNNGGGNSRSAQPTPVTTSSGLPVTSVKPPAETLSGATALNNAVSTPTAPGAIPTTGTGNNSDPQKSNTLDPRVIGSNFANDGQDEPTEGQVPSLTSTNNFINYCLTLPGVPITNGEQVESGSCNPIPIGAIPSTAKMPSSKFTFPVNFGTIKANEAFTIKMSIKNMVTGNFVNAKKSYFAAPQQLDASGTIIGHSHVVVERINSLEDTTVTDPKKFEFFKGLNGAAQNGILSADVTKGLLPGTYRLASINAAANHQPAIVPIAQHGSLDDIVYFTVTASGEANPANPNAPAPVSSSPVEPAKTEAPSAGTTTSPVSVPQPTVVAPIGNGNNLQKFTKALGNEKAPAVTRGGRGFVVEGSDDFLDVATALQRSCDIQKNKCADKANANRNSAFKVGDCEKQAEECRVAV